MSKVFANLPVTVFEAMSQLARDNDAINLGQGFPDDPGPEDIRRAAEFRAVREARTRTGAAGFLWKLYGRLAINNEPGNERSVEYNPRSTC